MRAKIETDSVLCKLIDGAKVDSRVAAHELRILERQHLKSIRNCWNCPNARILILACGFPVIQTGKRDRSQRMIYYDRVSDLFVILQDMTHCGGKGYSFDRWGKVDGKLEEAQ